MKKSQKGGYLTTPLAFWMRGEKDKGYQEQEEGIPRGHLKGPPKEKD